MFAPLFLSLSLSSRVKAARIVFQNFHGGHQWRRALIRSDATIPGPPRRFSRIRLGRHEFATLFRHGLFIPFLFDLFPPLLSRRTTDTAPFFFLSVFDGNSFAGTIGFLCWASPWKETFVLFRSWDSMGDRWFRGWANTHGEVCSICCARGVRRSREEL